MTQNYVHGYTDFENRRLTDQARTLDQLLHNDTIYPQGATVLEVGCGIGAQTEILCRNNPSLHLTSIDLSEKSLGYAKDRCRSAGITNVDFIQADIYDLPFDNHSFEHVFICFVLEHLPDVNKALQKIKPVIKPGGTITVIEGDHGSAYYYPRSTLAQKTIDCLVELQAGDGGDSLIGRSLYPLLTANNFSNVEVSPRMVYADASRPEMVDGFTLKTFIAMVEGIKQRAVGEKMISEEEWEQGISELRQSALSTGVFCYTFFKAKGTAD